jgi:hypothetical protein
MCLCINSRISLIQYKRLVRKIFMYTSGQELPLWSFVLSAVICFDACPHRQVCYNHYTKQVIADACDFKGRYLGGRIEGRCRLTEMREAPRHSALTMHKLGEISMTAAVVSQACVGRQSLATLMRYRNFCLDFTSLSLLPHASGLSTHCHGRS